MGQAIIKQIQLRTLEGKDLNGKRFAPYSSRYKDSLDFRLAGKSANQVDLRLTEEMMNSLEVLQSSTGSLTIGFSNPEASKKATWAEADDNGPSRKFMGVSDRELSTILGEYAAPNQATRGLALEILQRIFTFGK